MPDNATPNLPSRSFVATAAFYAKLGFTESWRDDAWMILERSGLTVEFFPYPDLDPASSAFSCCFRMDDVEAFFRASIDAGVHGGRCQLLPPQHQPIALLFGIGRLHAAIAEINALASGSSFASREIGARQKR